MNDLNRRAFRGLLRMALFLAVSVFLPAWTIDYWQGWVCLGLFLACATGISLYLMKNDPKLLERRMSAGAGAEKEKSQKIIQILAAMAFVATFVVPALDHRFLWSVVPTYAVIAGDVLIAWDHVARLQNAFRNKPDDFVAFPAPAGPKGMNTSVLPVAFARNAKSPIAGR